MEHGNGHASRLQLLAHHQRQQALRLHRVIRQPPEEVLKIGPQRREDRGHEAPEVHGDHRIRGQVRVGVQIRQVSVGIKLDLQRLLNGVQLPVLDLADAPGHGAVETGSVFQQIAHHGSLALGRQLDQFLINRPVGVHPVIVIGVDDAEGTIHCGFRAQQGVDRAEGLGASLRNVIEVRYGGIVLIDVGHLHRLALRRLFLLEIAHQLVHHLPHFRLDDEHHLVKAGPQGIVNGILHQNFAVGADAVHLLAAAVAGPKARRHDDQ